MPRKYEKKARAEQEEATRSRIAAVAAELHEQVGPARTTLSEIAERAGVSRPTVYKHFADDSALLATCSAHYRAQHPEPDPAAWAAVDDPEERLSIALRDLYAYYRDTRQMTAHVMRDRDVMPALAQLLEANWQPFVEAARKILIRGWGVRGAARKRLLAAIDLAIEFGTWRRLAWEGELNEPEAVEMMVALARTAAGR